MYTFSLTHTEDTTSLHLQMPTVKYFSLTLVSSVAGLKTWTFTRISIFQLHVTSADMLSETESRNVLLDRFSNSELHKESIGVYIRQCKVSVFQYV
jgi:hypothetical protein